MLNSVIIFALTFGWIFIVYGYDGLEVSSPWPGAGRGLNHQGLSLFVLGNGQASIDYTITNYGGATGTPPDIVFDSNGDFYLSVNNAMNRFTSSGDLVWSLANFYYPSPTLASDSTLYSFCLGYFCAIDTNKGSLKWSVIPAGSADSWTSGSIVVDDNGIVYVINSKSETNPDLSGPFYVCALYANSAKKWCTSLYNVYDTRYSMPI
jgi:hypothetical protein